MALIAEYRAKLEDITRKAKEAVDEAIQDVAFHNLAKTDIKDLKKETNEQVKVILARVDTNREEIFADVEKRLGTPIFWSSHYLFHRRQIILNEQCDLPVE